MAKVNPEDHGSAKPKVTVDDFEEEVAVVTIASYEEADIDDAEASEGTRKIAMLYFEETGDKAFYLNKTQIEYLIEGFDSDDSDDWVGQQVPIEKKRGKFRGTAYEKPYIVPPEDWTEYIEYEEVAKPKSRKAAKKVKAAKKAKKA